VSDWYLTSSENYLAYHVENKLYIDDIMMLFGLY